MKKSAFALAQIIVAAVLFLGSPTINSARASIVNLEFKGTYDTRGQTVFGLSGPAVPFEYKMTYDTALNTTSSIIKAGMTVNGTTYADSYYGYSASGITALSLTFGSQTWTSEDIVYRIPEVGYSADIWFDSDLNTESPTKTWIFAEIPGDCVLEIGGAMTTMVNGVQTSMFETRSSIRTRGPNAELVVSNGDMVITTAAAPVPIPSTMLLLGPALTALFGFKRKVLG